MLHFRRFFEIENKSLKADQKRPRCKAPEVLRNESYVMYVAMTKNKGNAADGYFSSAD
jgi:hypothetical protein